MSSWSNGGRDEDGLMTDAYFECGDCGLNLSWPITEGLPASQDPKQTEMRAMVEAHGWDDCGRSEFTLAPAVTAVAALPRGFYFNAEDWNGKKYQSFEGGRRQKNLQSVITNADHLIAALKTTRQFDRLGNIDHVLPQITAALADVVAQTNEFVSTVQRLTAEYRNFADAQSQVAGGQPVEPAAAVESPDVPAAAASTPDGEGGSLDVFEWESGAGHAPKPGPHLASVTVFDPNRSARVQLEELDQKAAPSPRLQLSMWPERERGGRR